MPFAAGSVQTGPLRRTAVLRDAPHLAVVYERVALLVLLVLRTKKSFRRFSFLAYRTAYRSKAAPATVQGAMLRSSYKEPGHGSRAGVQQRQQNVLTFRWAAR